MFGSELRWAGYYIWQGNSMGPSKLMGVAGDHMNYLFYEDLGVTVPDVRDVTYQANTEGVYRNLLDRLGYRRLLLRRVI